MEQKQDDGPDYHVLRREFILGSFALAGCSAPPDAIVGVRQTTAATTPKATHRLFIITTRALDPDPAVLFSDERSDRLGFAAVTVTIPTTHVPGRIERAHRLPPDPARHLTVIDPVLLQTEGAFVTALNAELDKRPREDRSVLVFVHGYNTSLADAILRLGQFVEDSGFRGVPVLFSWASGGRLLNYVYDLNSVLSARDDLLHAAEILGRTGARAADVVAHSMGNLLTVEAMRQAQLLGRFKERGRLRYIILASPDIDVDLFRRQLEPFPRDERRFFVLISRDDEALRVSRPLAGGVARVGAGDIATLTEIGVTVIDLSEIRVGESSHSKFADSPEIVRLIGARLSADGPLETAGRPMIGAQLLALPLAIGAAAANQ